MNSPFNFEAEPFEFESEFDEYEEEQSTNHCRCYHSRRNSGEFSEEYQEKQPDTYSGFEEEEESDFEGGLSDLYAEFDEAELYDEYSDRESFEVFKRRPSPICKAGYDDLVELKSRIDSLNYMWENGHLDSIEASSNSVIKQGNLIKARMKNGWYKRKGCTTKDLESIKKLKANR